MDRILDTVTEFWPVLLGLLDAAMILLVLLRKREPAAALGWTLAILLLPVLGSIGFLVFGMTRLPRRLRRKVRHREAFGERVERPAEGAREPGDGPWGALHALLKRLEVPEATAGSDVRLLGEGKAAFRRMFRAVRAARHHVHLEMYIFRQDRLGRALLELLAERAREGIEVRLCVDYVGTLARWTLLRRLRRAGGEGAVFLPLFPFGKRFVPNLRNHRKLLVCDGEVAFFGGLNIGEEYLGRNKPGRNWCDLQVEVRGPAVADVQWTFIEDWDFATGRLLDDDVYFPRTHEAGRSRVRIVAGGPDRDVNPIEQAFFHVFSQARQRLRIASPYVVPGPGLRAALAMAARRGVAVDLLTQGWPPDNLLADLAGWYFFDELLAAGVRIHRYEGGMMHGKMIVADDEIALLGSANLDNRSLQLNFELMGLFESATDVGPMVARFEEMLGQCRELTLEAYRERAWGRRLGEGVARLLAPLL